VEIFFLDVGQASCNVILLGNKQAIVIDGGSGRGALPLRFLKRCGVEKIAALIVTHSHADHIGGATAILGDFGSNIDRIWFVDDGKFNQSEFWFRVLEFIDERTLPRDCLRRLEHTDSPQIVWADPSSVATLRVFAPIAAQNLIAKEANNQNATSAVLILDFKSTNKVNRIVFAADSQLQEWQDIFQKYGNVICDVLSVPHHGGHVGGKAEDTEWLYSTAISADVALISAATTSKHHPRIEVVEALTRNGTKVMCSQISNRCTKDLEGARETGIPLLHSSQSSTVPKFKTTPTKKQKSIRVPCAGTVRVELGPSTLKVDSAIEHQQFVQSLTTSPVCPMCRTQERQLADHDQGS
jgi:beta-lactamase superfamily II metal-dependent hydrolase